MISPATPIRYFGCGPRVSRLRLSYRTHTNWSNREASASGIQGGFTGGVPRTEDRWPKNEDLPGVRPASYCPQNFWLAFVFVVRSRTHTHNHGETQVTYTLIGVTHTVAQLEVHIATPKNTMVLREKRQVCDAGSAAFFAQLTAQSHLQSFLSPQRPLIALSFCPNNPSLSTLRCWAFLLHKKCKEKKKKWKNSLVKLEKRENFQAAHVPLRRSTHHAFETFSGHLLSGL